MTWTRGSDDAGSYPDLMKVAGHADADERLVNELAGFVFRCYFQVARHTTDYVVDPGTAQMIGLSRWSALVALAEWAGLMTPIDKDGIKQWVMKADPSFMHVPTRAEIEWARQRKKDLDDPRLWVGILLRDGDNCRWCGIIVHWSGPKTSRSGVFDHLEPGQPGTVATMVTACSQCNQGRGADTVAWDSRHTLRPEPKRPIFGQHTAGRLTRNGWPTEPNHASDQTTATAGADTARPDQAVRSATPTPSSGRATAAAGTARPDQAVRPAAPAAADPAPSGGATRSATAPAHEVAESRPSLAGVSDSQSPESSLPGSGRDGSGDQPPTERPQGAGGGKRKRRGKRGGKKTGPKVDPAVAGQDPPAWAMDENEGGAA